MRKLGLPAAIATAPMVLATLLGAAYAPAPAQSAQSAPGPPVCVGPQTGRMVCDIVGKGTVTLPDGGSVYLTAAPVTLELASFIPPAGTELAVEAPPAGAVSIDPSGMTMGVPAEQVISLMRTDGPGLDGCAPLAGQVNAIRCPLPLGGQSTSPPHLAFISSDASSEPPRARSFLVGNGTALLVSPAPAPSAPPAVLTVAGQGSEQAILSWDGNELDVAADNGTAVVVAPGDGCRSGAEVPKEPDASPTLYPPSAVACSPVTGGTVSVTTIPPASADYPGSALLPAGGALRFTATAPDQAPGTPGSFYRQTPLTVVSNSDQQASLSFDGKTLMVSVPLGFAVEALGGQSTPADCTPLDGGADRVSCDESDPLGMLGVGVRRELALSTLPSGGPLQGLLLPAHASASLSFPVIDAEGTAQTVSILGSMEQPATLSWDGFTLDAIAPDGFGISQRPALPYPAGVYPPGPPRADCQTDAMRPSLLSCSTPAGSSSVDLAISLPPLTGRVTLPYEDANGAGALTISATGPAAEEHDTAIAVTLARGGAELDGSGIFRPWQSESAHIYFSLDDGRAGGLLYEGTMSRQGTRWTAVGLALTPGADVPIASWSSGPPAPAAAGEIFVGIDAGRGVGQPALPGGPPMPGPMLPELVGPNLTFDPMARGVVPSSPTRIVSAGETLGFLAAGSPVADLPSATLSYHWDFGDGTTADASTQAMTHVYASPGTYIVTAVVRDSDGASAFGAGEVEVAGL